MDNANDLLARADRLAASNPGEAARCYARVLAIDPANLTAHNALESLDAPQRYGRWMHVNCVIDPRDDIFRFFANHPLSINPIRDYLADGWRTMSELMVLLERLDHPLLKMASVLEFAAGFGRFTRHLARVLPGCVTCADIQPGSVEFLREQFRVEAFYSSIDPTAARIPGRYDLVLVLSMFTHLPVGRWAGWLKRLHQALRPNGLLLFSVHNEAAATQAGIVFDERGTHFVRSSESPQLGGDEYGTTFTTDVFVASQVEVALGRRPLAHEHLAFWVAQDAVVVAA
jgi:SAM-dependent methyltransferase